MLVKFLQLMQDTHDQSVELVGIIARDAFLNMKEFAPRQILIAKLNQRTNYPLRRRTFSVM